MMAGSSSYMYKIGFLVNPIAGMGGAVGLKGTDGKSYLEEAIKRGAIPLSPRKAKVTLQKLYEYRHDFTLLTCSGVMGENIIKEVGYKKYTVLYHLEGPNYSTAEDTKKVCNLFLEFKVDFILFCGGDGTARDIFTVVREEIPILGIPAGVKMHSAVFGITPKISSEIVKMFLKGKTETQEAEIMDTDENLYRKGRLQTKIYGYAKTPYVPTLVQAGKSIFYNESDSESKENIAQFAYEFMNDDSLYILGAGTTIEAIASKLKIKKTLLGVDLVKNRKLIMADVNEKEILDVLEKEKKAKILISPIGAQGFIFGRGNQQISHQVIKKVGIDNIIILATPYKLSKTPILLVDTGDEELDKKLSGYQRIITGYRIAQRHQIGLNIT